MKIKITKSVVHGAKIHKKDSVVDLPDKEANHLIDGEFAVVHDAEKTRDNSSVQSREELFKQFKKASKEELLQVKAGAEKVLAAEPGRKDAEAVLEVVTQLLEKK